jgi:NAD(P)H-dependent FMN reductase
MPKTIAVLRGSPRNGSLTEKLARGIELAVGDRLTFRDVSVHGLPLYNPDLEQDQPHAD